MTTKESKIVLNVQEWIAVISFICLVVVFGIRAESKIKGNSEKLEKIEQFTKEEVNDITEALKVLQEDVSYMRGKMDENRKHK